MSLTYGYDLKHGDKNFRSTSSDRRNIVTASAAWGSTSESPPVPCAFQFSCYGRSVSLLFSVRYIPSWVPYLSYEPVAQILRKLSVTIRNEPIDFVKNALVCGDHAPSVLI